MILLITTRWSPCILSITSTIPSWSAQNDNLVSINSTIEVDFMGQAASDTMGYKQFSGIGGQVDFSFEVPACPGAAVPLLAMPSTAAKGYAVVSCLSWRRVLPFPPPKWYPLCCNRVRGCSSSRSQCPWRGPSPDRHCSSWFSPERLIEAGETV